MLIVSFFTDQGAPKPGLTPTITIVDIDLDVVVINAAAMTALTAMTHCYTYDFVTYDEDKNYAITIDGGATLNDIDRYQFATNDEANIKDDVILIEKINSNRWRIDSTTNQLTIYDDDETTPLLVFNLKNEAGVPTTIGPAERDPV